MKGDKVRVLEPIDKSEYPLFTPRMEESIGNCYVIIKSWLELVNSKGLNETPVNKLLLLV